VLAIIPGLDTTRQTISQGLLALDRNPDQRQLWMDNFDQITPTAVEELLRWSTPVAQFRRVATADTVLGEQLIGAGQTVMLLYASANRDGSVFSDPYRLDLRREPNRHVSFGAPGSPHLCLGNHLGRREIQAMFRAIFERLPDIRVAGDPVWLRSSSLNAIKQLPVKFTPRKRQAV
jgi:cytochrome P450